MPISLSCKCGKKFKAPETMAGKTVKCPGCSQPLQIPRPGGQSPSTSAPKALKVACSCGKNLMVKGELAGKSIRCPSCGSVVTVAPKKESAPRRRDPVGEILDEVDLRESATGHRCPECRHELEADDILCVKCGFNLETGKKMMTKTSQKRDALGRLTSAKARQQGKKKSRSASADNDAKIIVGVLALVAVPSVLLWFVDPALAIFAATAGAWLVNLGGAIWIVIVALKEDGPLQAILCFFCGPYLIYYVIKHLDDTKTPAVLWVVGLVAGIMVSVLSPTLLATS